LLDNALERFIRLNPKRNITLVLDNARTHRTVLMKLLTQFHGIEFLFLSENNPYFNVIEFVVRVIKPNLKREFSMR